LLSLAALEKRNNIMEIKVGEIIKAKREEKGYNLIEFSEKIGISAGYLSQIENGRKTNPKLDIILKIIHELDIEIEMLLGLESSEESYLSRIPSLLKLTLAKDRNLKTLSDPDVLRKFNFLSNKILESNYVFEDKMLYKLFLEDISNQTENTLKRYMALQLLMKG
jgi:transcriptional regulator with XRE-family HTH domain